MKFTVLIFLSLLKQHQEKPINIRNEHDIIQLFLSTIQAEYALSEQWNKEHQYQHIKL